MRRSMTADGTGQRTSCRSALILVLVVVLVVGTSENDDEACPPYGGTSSMARPACRTAPGYPLKERAMNRATTSLIVPSLSLCLPTHSRMYSVLRRLKRDRFIVARLRVHQAESDKWQVGSWEE